MHSRFDTLAAIVLPGTGSDARFAEDAFSTAFAGVGLTTIAVEPDPTGVVESYLDALNAATRRHGRIVVAGISLGAAVAARWAADNASSITALALVLPAWTGDPAGTPAALSAQFTARSLREAGLDAVSAAMSSSSPEWLARTLRRSWAAQWPALPDALDEAARHRSLELDELARVELPTVVVGAVDDAVHPIEVSRSWARALPNCVLRTVTLDMIGSDAGCLGRAAVDGLGLRSPQPPSC
ncbi:alpha/beta fold hydrolase [Rhodococcus ruber]|uniref:Alpha/beta fold hydrolase n=1 Tax=Rhodococcus ruber TaxID=1830 RepID=A0ABT4MBP4_9NOCA|nr:alpha/beta fold hydrolase [Rhodococcus ruber]MCZ4518397.1 alpha/beta fold hydrolase [Rhodococcus ruber]